MRTGLMGMKGGLSISFIYFSFCFSKNVAVLFMQKKEASNKKCLKLCTPFRVRCIYKMKVFVIVTVRSFGISFLLAFFKVLFSLRLTWGTQKDPE